MGKENRSVRGRPYPRLANLEFALLLAAIATEPVFAQDMKTVSSSLASRIAASGRKTVAVIDFTDLQGNVTELGRFLAEELSVDLVGDAKGFEVIERTQLKTILQEHKLATTGLIDPQTARKLGQIAGVDALVTGTITPFGDSVRLSTKVLDTSTAKMIGASTTDIPRTKAIDELLAKGIGGAGQSSPVPSSRGTETVSTISVETNRFLIAIRRCSRSREELVCTGSVTNKAGEKRGLDIEQFDSYVMDDLGHQYKIEQLVLGARGTRQDLEPDLELTLWVRVRDFDPKATSVNVLLSYRWAQPNDGWWQAAKALLREIAAQ